MNGFRKWCGLLFLGLVITLALAGCQSGAAESTPTDRARTPTQMMPTITPAPTRPHAPTPTSSIVETARDIRGLSLRLWFDLTPEETAVFQELVAQFNAGNPYEIEILADLHAHTLADDVRLAYGGAEPADIMLGFADDILDLNRFPGLVADLNIYYADPLWGMAGDEATALYPPLDEDWEHGGMFALPVYRRAQVLFYNQTFGRSLGFDAPPATLDEFVEQACTAAQVRGDGAGGWTLEPHPYLWLAWLYAHGAQVYDRGTQTYHLDSLALQDGLSRLSGLYREGCLWFGGDAEAFAERKALFYSASLVEVPYIEAALARQGSADVWLALPYPGIGEGGDVLLVYGRAAGIVTPDPVRRLAAWAFLRWLAQPQQVVAWDVVSRNLPLNPAGVAFEDMAGWGGAYSPLLQALPQAMGEPGVASWRVVRWTLDDAIASLLTPEFDPQALPALVEELDRTADEVHQYQR